MTKINGQLTFDCVVMCLHFLHVKIEVFDAGEEVMVFTNSHMQVGMPVLGRIGYVGCFLCKFRTHGSFHGKYHGCIDWTQPPLHPALDMQELHSELFGNFVKPI